MFRMTRIFANGSVEIHKIEGKVTDEVLPLWQEQLAALQPDEKRDILLDFSQVWALSAAAIEILIGHLRGSMRVMNPGMDLRNLLHAAGLSTSVLE